MYIKRLFLSVLGGFLVIIVFLFLGLVVQRTGHPLAAQSFNKYSLRWAMWPLSFVMDTGQRNKWLAISLSWCINLIVYALVIYFVQLLWSKRTRPNPARLPESGIGE